MRRRTRRTLLGSFMLSAAVLSWAEAVAAAFCAPREEAGSMLAMPGMVVGDAAFRGSMGDMPMPLGNGGSDEEAPADPCPLAPALGAGCTAMASLPTTVIEEAAQLTRGSERTPFTSVRRDLLLAHPFFHPPRT
jgi:hypothetical protein